MTTRLQNLMQEAGLSQYRLSKLTPLNQGRLSLFCNGKTVPSQAETKLIEDYFYPLTVNYLMSETER